MIKRIAPQSLFGRALLILVLPIVLVQAVTAYVFFDRHWDTVTRYLSTALAGEIAFMARQMESAPPARRRAIVAEFEVLTGIEVTMEPADTFAQQLAGSDYPEFQEQLRARLHGPFTVRKTPDASAIEIRLRMPGHTLVFESTVKRLESRTTTILVLWMVGASLLFSLIGLLFLRNQVRPIVRLAEAADSFGRGVELQNFRPQGATEVRKAARAFIIMRERIKRQIRTRTEMLAAVSHDLRTPLTRIKLQLAMLRDDEATHGLAGDVAQMEHMIGEYLDFARGDGREEAQRVELRALLADIIRDYERLGKHATLDSPEAVETQLKPMGFRRLMENVIDNALRYGGRCAVSVRRTTAAVEICVEDDGPGIPHSQREEVFRPFTRLERSRNIKTGGAGLGLTIARDIALAHGGAISLDDAALGGLRVTIRLPL